MLFGIALKASAVWAGAEFGVSRIWGQVLKHEFLAFQECYIEQTY